MHDDIGAVIDRAQQNRRGDGVVDDERNAVALGDARQRLDVADVAGRIADALAEDRARFVVDQLFDRVGPVGLGEAHGDALARQNVGEQRIGRAVKLRHRNDVGAHRGEIEHRVVQRRLAGADAQRVDAAFEQGNAPFEHRDRRIADPAVAIALGFEIEQRGAVIGAVELVGHGLIDRHRDGFGRRIGFVAAVNGQCFVFHASRRLSENTADSRPIAFLIRGRRGEQRKRCEFEGITLIVCHAEPCANGAARGRIKSFKFYPFLKRKIHFVGRCIESHGPRRDRNAPSRGSRGTDSALRDWVRALEATAPIAGNPRRILPDAIEELAQSRGDAEALISERGTLTYRALVERSRRYARWALDQDLAKGETVCLMMPNRPEYMAIWLGITSVGGVVSLINTQLRGPSLAHCIDIVAPTHVIVAAECIEQFRSARLVQPAENLVRMAAADYPRIDREIERFSAAPLTDARAPHGDDRRPRADDLHLRHDRPAEGGQCQPPPADAVEPLVRRPDEYRAGRPHVRLPADVSLDRRRGGDRRACWFAADRS